jgi:uncharacterized protein
MNPLDIIFDHYKKGLPLTDILIRHSEQVRDKALAIAEKIPHLKPDVTFISEAAMLHDIGIYKTFSPKIGCHGKKPYICHGVIGGRILKKYGLKSHALVCERHVGVGLTRKDIKSRNLPLPRRDMSPISIEEIIICYADEFFSKTNGAKAHSVEKVIAKLECHGDDRVRRFESWHHLFTDS